MGLLFFFFPAVCFATASFSSLQGRLSPRYLKVIFPWYPLHLKGPGLALAGPLVRVSSRYARVSGSVPNQGTYNQPMNA